MRNYIGSASAFGTHCSAALLLDSKTKRRELACRVRLKT